MNIVSTSEMAVVALLGLAGVIMGIWMLVTGNYKVRAPNLSPGYKPAQDIPKMTPSQVAEARTHLQQLFEERMP